MSARESARLRSLNQRISNAADIAGHDVQRVRRQIAFHRLLARTQGSGWVLKGGYCLEARLGGQARATKDIDFVRRESSLIADELLDELDSLFARSEVEDGFTFEALSAKLMRNADDPVAAWRVKVGSDVDGRRFETLTLDVVSQFSEVADAVESLSIPSPVRLLGYEAVDVEAVDVYQHAAEKFHAMSRVYSGGRPSSRVKDMVDLALLDEAGLLSDLPRLRSRLVVVHQQRDGQAPPSALPHPPGDWASGYTRIVAELDLSIATSDDAFARVHALYRAALEGPLP